MVDTQLSNIMFAIKKLFYSIFILFFSKKRIVNFPRKYNCIILDNKFKFFSFKNIALYENSFYYYFKKHQISQILKKTKIEIKSFIDIGAFIGLYSVIFRSLNKKAEIFSIEPIKNNFLILKKNIKKDNKNYLFNVGISDKSGKKFFTPPDFYLNRTLSKDLFLSKQILSMYSLENKKNKNSVKCNIYPLDEIVRPMKIKNSFLKIDTEGHELNVIQNIFKKKIYPKIIALEINNHYIYSKKNTIFKMLSLLEKNKYNKVFTFTNRNSMKRITINSIPKLFLGNPKGNFIKSLFFPKAVGLDFYFIKNLICV